MSEVSESKHRERVFIQIFTGTDYNYNFLCISIHYIQYIIPLNMRSWVIPTLLVGLTCAYYLQGTEQSYMIFSKWNACVNASISFDFRTNEEKSLLMYTDDGGKYDFMQVIYKSFAKNLKIPLKCNIFYMNTGRFTLYRMFTFYLQCITFHFYH